MVDIQGTNHFSLFCDNLSAQLSEEFRKAISQLKGICWYGLPNALWQPVDAGYGSLLKFFIQHAHSNWLEVENNADRWFGNVQPYCAKERRILISHWAGEAYKKLISDKYNSFRLRL